MWLEGKSGNPAGRPRGAENIDRRTVKEFVMAAFEKLQNDPDYCLEAWAKKEPTEFYRIASRLIPTDIKAEVTQVREIQLTTKRGKPAPIDIDHEIVLNDQGSNIEPAGIPPGPTGSIRTPEALQRGGLWSPMGEDGASPGSSVGS
jgi:hypothetical protein